MLKTKLTTGLFTFIISSAFAQFDTDVQLQELDYALLPPENYSYKIIGTTDTPKHLMSLVGLEEIQHGSYNVYFKEYWPAMVHKGDKSKLSIAGTTFVPRLTVVHFDKEAELSNVQAQMINLKDVLEKEDLTYTASTHINTMARLDIGNSEEDLRLEQLKAKYPGAFPAQYSGLKGEEVLTLGAQPTLGGGLSINQYARDKYTGVSVYAPNLTRIEEMKVEPVGFEGKPILYKEYVYNPIADVITVYGGDRIKSKEIKRSEFKFFSFMTYDAQGKLVKQVTKKYPFALQEMYSSFVQDETTGESYQVFIFGKRPFMKKYSDPEKGNYELLVFNEKGEEVLAQKFHYGEKDYILDPIALYADQGKYTLLTTSSVAADFSFLTLDGKTAVEKTITKEDLLARTEGQTELGLSFKPFRKLRYKLLETVREGRKLSFVFEGKLLVKKESKDEEGKTIPAVYSYPSYSILEIDLNKQDVVKQFVIEKQNMPIAQPAQLRTLINAEGQAVFLINTKDKTPNELAKRGFLAENSEFNLQGESSMTRTNVLSYNAYSSSCKFYAPEPTFNHLYGIPTYRLTHDKLYLFGSKTPITGGKINLQLLKISL